MATFAIGDIHGCFDTLQALLRRLRFDPRSDRLWLVGDLVNRGPKSLAVLRWAADLGDRATVVLGNHDLHLLGRALGIAAAKRRDTLADLLDAPDCDDLLRWLRTRPLLHRQDDVVMIHAGLFPSWTVDKAERMARLAEAQLQGTEGLKLLQSVEQKNAERWKSGMPDGERARITLAGLARMRTLQEDGRMCPEFSGPPKDAPKGCVPWFAVPGRKSAGSLVIFGHWAALGLWVGEGVIGLDSGCAWGQALTALRLEDLKLFQEPAVEKGMR
jgi:bis(5'-nucleosyl)-tetraphosphatase (symmetrical)